MFKRNLKSQWAKALAVVLERDVDEVPKGWLKMSEVAKEMNLSEEQAGKAITLLKQKGMVEAKKFKIKTDKKTKMIRPTFHYRLISSLKENYPRVYASNKS